MSVATKQSSQSVWSLLADIGSGTVSIFKGHWVTLKTLFRKKVTDQYPYRYRPEREWHPRPGYRGDFALIGDAERPDGLRCIACMACANACPTKCIHIVGDGKGKERHASQFHIDIGLCMYCWMCVEVCPVAALTMTTDYHNVSYLPEGMIRNIEDLRARGENIPEPEVPVAPEKSTLQSAKRKSSGKAKQE